MSDSYLGQIITFAGNFAIKGTALCNGQLVPISQNTALFSLLGTFYGGNGTSNFALPNLQGRSMVHQGQGNGLSSLVIGEAGGSESATVTLGNLPSHTHAMTSSFHTSGLQPHATTLAPAAGSVLGHADDVSGDTPKAQPAIYCPAGTTPTIALAGLNVSAGPAGGSSASFPILNPYLTISCLIFLFGIFPSRN